MTQYVMCGRRIVSDTVDLVLNRRLSRGLSQIYASAEAHQQVGCFRENWHVGVNC